jgi:hypothetical protein
MRAVSTLFLGIIAVGGLACASGESAPVEQAGAGGSGGSPSTGGGSSAPSSSTGTGGLGGQGGAPTASGGASEGGGGHGGSGCYDYRCANACPEGYWAELDGCPKCACAPPALAFIVNGTPRNPEIVTLQTTASQYIGGIDRWVFDFAWTYDDPQAADDAEELITTVRLMRLGPTYEPGPDAATWYYPQDSDMPFETLGGTYTLYGFGVISEDEIVESGFISIRRVNDTFEGGVWLELEPIDGMGPSVEVHGPFSVSVPP